MGKPDVVRVTVTQFSVQDPLVAGHRQSTANLTLKQTTSQAARSEVAKGVGVGGAGCRGGLARGATGRKLRHCRPASSHLSPLHLTAAMTSVMERVHGAGGELGLWGDVRRCRKE